MKRLLKTLETLEFTEGESKVYIALIKLGESKVGPLIKESGISRSKVYDILDRLTEKGVTSQVKKQGILYFQALPAQALLNIIRTKEKKLKREEKAVKDLLPTLEKIRKKPNIDVTVYGGFEGFKAMIDRTIDELKPQDTYEAMGVSKTTEGMRHYARKIYENQKKKKFKAKSIFDKEGVFKMTERKAKGHEMRVLPKEWNTPALFTIYSDTVGIHLGSKETTMSVVLKNEEIAQSFRTAFKAMWKQSKQPK